MNISILEDLSEGDRKAITLLTLRHDPYFLSWVRTGLDKQAGNKNKFLLSSTRTTNIVVDIFPNFPLPHWD